MMFSTCHLIEMLLFINMPDKAGDSIHYISFFIERMLSVC